MKQSSTCEGVHGGGTEELVVKVGLGTSYPSKEKDRSSCVLTVVGGLLHVLRFLAKFALHTTEWGGTPSS